ncbi:RICIN domain-containing protein [Streptomyces mirabilis]|uniref:RICIN domain-containing protein n=1 Tax=Streptomyces mirabilis TaxID=68239 RepID=UPI0033D9D299
MYGAWPVHEFNPDLVLRARKALDLRGDETQAAHGAIHRTFARARLKDGAGVYSNIKKILGNGMVFKSLMTSHNPHLMTYNADAAHALPAMLSEAMVYSRPGILEVLPALPDQLSKGTIKGVRGRNRIRVESLTWDLDERTATVVLTSDVTQNITLISRRGMTSVTTTATVAPSPLGSHARGVSLTAGARTTITIGLLSGAFCLVNRRSGKVLDIKDGSTADGATAIVWAWSAASTSNGGSSPTTTDPSAW